VKRGNSTEEVLNRVSRNLVFMRSTWDGLAVASGTRKKITANRGREDDEARVIRIFSVFSWRALTDSVITITHEL
jgi:hypothetical protein